MSLHKYRRGEVIWVPFTYTDFSGGKARPAVIVSAPDFTVCRGDYILAAITGQVTAHRGHPTCYTIQDWKAAGLAMPSVVVSHLICLSPLSMGARIGRLSSAEMRGVETCLRAALGL
jgi:mRNA-degrading endonuclease toxin of MazEF toxin-antitoxin module